MQEILKDNQSFGLNDALNRIQDRPWLIDSFDQFMARLKNVISRSIIAFCFSFLFSFFLLFFVAGLKSFMTKNFHFYVVNVKYIRMIRKYFTNFNHFTNSSLKFSTKFALTLTVNMETGNFFYATIHNSMKNFFY